MANDVALTQESQDWQLLKKQCTAFAMSNLLPKHVYDGARNENEVLARAMTIAFKGRELGIPPLYALSEIAVINGKPALSATLMLSLVLRKYPEANPEFQLSDTAASLTMTRPGGKPQTFKFSIEDAKKAGLLDKPGPWKSYTRAMLKSRVVSEACRALFPEALMGIFYTHEELGGQPIDIETNETVSAAPSPKAVQKEALPEGVTEQDVAARRVLNPTGNTVNYDERAAKKLAEQCTEPQRKKLHAVCRELGWSKEELKEWLFEKFGVDSSKELTKSQASEAFKLLEITAPEDDDAKSFSESETRTNA